MNYNIKGTDIVITDELRGYIEKKLATFEKFLSNAAAARADVELQFLVGEAKTYRAELMIHDPGMKAPLRAEARGHTLHETFDLVTDELFTELTRAKKKRLHLIRRGAARVKDILRGFRPF